MKIADVLKSTSEKKLLQASKLPIRELEEIKKNHFIAFVDDGNESYDVSIFIRNNIIIEHNCDCNKNSDFCLHQLAVMNEIVGNKKLSSSTTKGKRQKKVNETDALIQQIDADDLKNWLSNYLKTNKETERHFLLDFSKKEIQFTVDEVENIITDSIKSVIGNKRGKVAISEVKKIIDLLEKSLSPIVDYIEQNILSTEIVLPITLKICDLLLEFHYKSKTTSVRIENFIKNVIDKYAFFVNKIEVEEQWKKISLKHWENVFIDAGNYISINHINLCFEIYLISSIDRKKIIAEYVLNKLKSIEKNELKYNQYLNVNLLTVLIENNLLKETIDYFTPIYYNNEYNEKLLNALKIIDEEKTISYCKKIIEYNRNEKYNLPSYKILLEIYEKQNNTIRLIELKRKLLRLFPFYET
ncbi:hypothetical protein [Chishuiella sp.]|uniref:hypothetical protein n=1 Tax=Chishuiella sp. TaxID=1969467 RepID=UPI0028AD53E0|nr:hypothetical protein [Chishuiella sp.]